MNYVVNILCLLMANMADSFMPYTNGINVISNRILAASNIKDNADSSRNTTNVKVEVFSTFGPNGNRRPATIIAGEKLHVQIKISGITLTNEGKANTIIKSELLDSGQKQLFQFPDEYIDGKPTFGGTSATHTLFIQSQRDISPGKYHLQINVADKISKESTTETLTFEILPKTTFGAINIGLFHDPEGKCPACGNVTVGEKIFLLFWVAGFANSNGRVHITNTLTTHDSTNVVLTKLKVLEIDQPMFSDTNAAVPVSFWVGANRPGKFTLRLEAKDHIANKSKTYELPLIVSPPPRIEDVKEKTLDSNQKGN